MNAYVNKNMITKAIDDSRLRPELIAEAIGVTLGDLAAWQDGTQLPSIDQARRFAEFVNVPLGYLWLSAIPQAAALTATEIRERPNSIEVHRSGKGEWATTTKIYFGDTQEDGEAAKEWLDALNLRLLLTYPPVDLVQAEILEHKLQLSIEGKDGNG